MRGRYVFRSRWRLPADPDAVYAALADVTGYPRWWPQVRRARQLDDRAGEITCRSLLPYDLTFVAEREVEDPVGHVLQARLSGDLNGWSRWRVVDGGAIFEQDVTVGGMLRRAGPLARPLLRFNHDVMMASGERGLRRYLASGA